MKPDALRCYNGYDCPPFGTADLRSDHDALNMTPILRSREREISTPSLVGIPTSNAVLATVYAEALAMTPGPWRAEAMSEGIRVSPLVGPRGIEYQSGDYSGIQPEH